MSTTWKNIERRVARQLSGRRMGPGPDRADVRAGTGDWLCVEVKQRQTLPAWLKAAVDQARRYATAKQLPLAVIHEHGRHDCLVVMRLSDFRAWFGELGAAVASDVGVDGAATGPVPGLENCSSRE